MGSWLKEKYREIILQSLISVLIIFVGFWAYGWRDSGRLNEMEHKELRDKKASVEYVNRQNFIQDKVIDNKADKSLVESMDDKLDIIINKLSN
jgi:hypothetical protein